MFLLSAKYAYEDPKQSIRMKHREFVRLLSILTILLGILVVLTGEQRVSKGLRYCKILTP